MIVMGYVHLRPNWFGVLSNGLGNCIVEQSSKRAADEMNYVAVSSEEQCNKTV